MATDRIRWYPLTGPISSRALVDFQTALPPNRIDIFAHVPPCPHAGREGRARELPIPASFAKDVIFRLHRTWAIPQAATRFGALALFPAVEMVARQAIWQAPKEVVWEKWQVVQGRRVENSSFVFLLPVRLDLHFQPSHAPRFKVTDAEALLNRAFSGQEAKWFPSLSWVVWR